MQMTDQVPPSVADSGSSADGGSLLAASHHTAVRARGLLNGIAAGGQLRLFIAVDGAEGVGKTTIAKLLCARLKGVYLPFGYDMTRAKLRELEQFGPVARCTEYLAAMASMAPAISRANDAGAWLIADGWVLSLFATCVGQSSDCRALFPIDLPIPFCQVTASAPGNVRRERLRQRLEAPVDDHYHTSAEREIDLQERIDSFIRSRVDAIDTSILTPDEAVASVIDHLGLPPAQNN